MTLLVSDEPSLLTHQRPGYLFGHDETLDDLVAPDIPSFRPAAPHSVSSYYGLLEEGCSYGLASYGDGYKVVLFGNADFQRRGINLFCSFGGATVSERITDSISAVVVTDKETFIDRDAPFPEEQSKTAPIPFERAIALYLYGQMHEEETRGTDIYDEDGCFVGSREVDEGRLFAKALRLAKLFRAEEMPPAYAVLNQQGSHGGMTVYSMGRLSAENPSD